MKRKYIRRIPTREDLSRKVAALAGLNSRVVKKGYLTHASWLKLFATLDKLTTRIKELENGNIQ